MAQPLYRQDAGRVGRRRRAFGAGGVPGFAADCLETLEEIDSENREIFLHAGGESFAYIPALNARPTHIDALARIIAERLP